MTTEVLKIDADNPEPEAIARAAKILLSGGLVAFPTETVYGLGGLADDASSIAKIYAAKRRPARNPLIAHVVGEEDARRIARSWPTAASALAREFWPGPLTLVVPRGPSIPRALAAGLDAMAIRAPKHPVAIALLKAVGRPVAAPSANPFTQLSPTRAEHVLKGLGSSVDLILDAGPCSLGIESTVVDVTRDPPRVLRPGSITVEQLARIVAGTAMSKRRTRSGEMHRSPGMERRHYAPRAKLIVAERDTLANAAKSAERPVGVVTIGTTLGIADANERALSDDPVRYAAALFDVLHALDDLGCKTIVLQSVPSAPSWAAVRDRLDRASAI